jgi:hypothetical protein
VYGDGFADLVIGSLAGSGTPQGVSYVYLGAASGLGTTPTNIPDPVTINGFAGFNFIAVARAGDVNGDGLSDVATR